MKYILPHVGKGGAIRLCVDGSRENNAKLFDSLSHVERHMDRNVFGVNFLPPVAVTVNTSKARR